MLLDASIGIEPVSEPLQCLLVTDLPGDEPVTKQGQQRQDLGHLRCGSRRSHRVAQEDLEGPPCVTLVQRQPCGPRRAGVAQRESD